MLNFNEYGLLPEGIHKIALAEFQKIFGFNDKRKDMIREGLGSFLKEWAPYPIERIYLDGSFVTQKENPGDIDGYAITRSDSRIFTFIVKNQERWRLDYRMDFYWALTDAVREHTVEHWENFFSKVPGDPAKKKGYVALLLKTKGSD